MTPTAASEALLDPLPASVVVMVCHGTLPSDLSLVSFSPVRLAKDLTNGFVGSFAKLIKRFLNDSDTGYPGYFSIVRRCCVVCYYAPLTIRPFNASGAVWTLGNLRTGYGADLRSAASSSMLMGSSALLCIRYMDSAWATIETGSWSFPGKIKSSAVTVRATEFVNTNFYQPDPHPVLRNFISQWNCTVTAVSLTNDNLTITTRTTIGAISEGYRHIAEPDAPGGPLTSRSSQ